MPDATGLELLARTLRERDADSVLDAVHFRGKGALEVAPAARSRATLEALRGEGYRFLASVHGVDYYPEEPRLGVHYELLDMEALDRLTVKAARPDGRAAGAVGDAELADRRTTRSARSTTCSA